MRDIDKVIVFVRDQECFSEVEKLIIEARLEHDPTPNEIMAAREELRVIGLRNLQGTSIGHQRYTDPIALERMASGTCPECGKPPDEHTGWGNAVCSLTDNGVAGRLAQFTHDHQTHP